MVPWKQILAALTLAVASLGSAQALQFTWLKPIGVNPYTFVQRTAVSPTGAFVVAGVTQNSAATDDSADLYINSYTPLGILSWTRIYNSTADNAEGIRGMAIDSTGAVIVCGWEALNSSGRQRAFVRKYTRFGGLAWHRTFEGNQAGPAQFAAVAVDASNNVYVTGTALYAGRSKDLVIAKYSTGGTRLF